MPVFTSQLGKVEKLDEQDALKSIANHIRKIQEELEYRLANLDSENITSLDASQTKISTVGGNLNQVLQDAAGNISLLERTAEGLSSLVSDNTGAISELQQTAGTLSSRITDTEGDISTLTQTANGLSSRISDAEGDISTLTQTANSLSSRISDTEGDISSLTQTVNGFSLSVSNGTSSSTIKLMSGSTVISSKTISFSGMVTFSDLSTSGATTINGSNITTGTITSNYLRLYGNMTVYTTSSLSAYGGYIGYTTSANDGSKGIHMGYSTTSGDVVATANGAKLVYGSSSNQIYISNGGAGIHVGGTQTIYTTSSNIQTTGPLLSTNKSTLGNASFLWGQIYSSNSAISKSDANMKHSIEDLPDKYLTLFDGLIPRRYKLNDGTSDRYHVGFIAQEVAAAMTAAGVDSQEFGGFIRDTDEETGEDIYFLRYEEFIGILAAKISALETRIHTLEETA